MTEVPRQANEPEPGVGSGSGGHQVVSVVAASVVNENRLGVRIEGVHQCAKPFCECREYRPSLYAGTTSEYVGMEADAMKQSYQSTTRVGPTG